MKIVKTLYFIAAIAILIGAASRLFLPEAYAYIYTSGAVLFAVTQFILRPRHTHFAVRRLVFKSYRMSLDCNTTLTLEVHIVQKLV